MKKTGNRIIDIVHRISPAEDSENFFEQKKPFFDTGIEIGRYIGRLIKTVGKKRRLIPVKVYPIDCPRRFRCTPVFMSLFFRQYKKLVFRYFFVSSVQFEPAVSFDTINKYNCRLLLWYVPGNETQPVDNNLYR